MASSETAEPQATLDYTEREGFTYTPLALATSPSVSTSATRRELQAWGLGDWIGQDPFALLDFGDPGEYRRYQYDEIYSYRRGRGDDAEYFPVEFRVWINTVGEIPDTLKRLFQTRENGRLQYIFDSGPYEGHMTGFSFFSRATNEEDDEIAADEATNLGIPQFEVLVHMDGQVKGHAGGFFDPFQLTERVPDEEEWKITKNEAREEYEFRPQGRARERLMGTSKQVALNGKYIGNITPSRGTAALAFSYSSNDNTWKNRETGRQMWSREKFITEGFFTPQAIRAGSKVYKIHEDENNIVLQATKPEGFDPVQPELLPSDVVEGFALERADETVFDIRFDQGELLGRYDTPTTRTTGRATDLLQA